MRTSNVKERQFQRECRDVKKPVSCEEMTDWRERTPGRWAPFGVSSREIAGVWRHVDTVGEKERKKAWERYRGVRTTDKASFLSG